MVDWAVQKLFRIAGDEDAEVAGLAAQSLTRWRDVVSPLVSKALHGEDHRRWRAALRFLGTQPGHPFLIEIPDKVWKEVLGQSMIWVPPGPFLMGSDEIGDLAEYPRHEVTLPGYWIGRYPVTVTQWRAFVQASGFKCEEKSLKSSDDHPVCYVDWDDAIAYCRWLSKKTGLPVTLPSEAEWEKAARGKNGNKWPWGNKFDPNKCNSDENRNSPWRNKLCKDDITPVGLYSPRGDSPYGCADMAGNIWQWTRSKYSPYPYKMNDGREDLRLIKLGDRTIRGGSHVDKARSVRCAVRGRVGPHHRSGNLGFRIVVSPLSS